MTETTRDSITYWVLWSIELVGLALCWFVCFGLSMTFWQGLAGALLFSTGWSIVFNVVTLDTRSMLRLKKAFRALDDLAADEERRYRDGDWHVLEDDEDEEP